MNDGPTDPFGTFRPTDNIAVSQHEMVTSYQAAGFTREEAIHMTLTMFTTWANIKAQAEEAKQRGQA